MKMKKIVCLIVVLTMVVSASGFAFAADSKNEGAPYVGPAAGTTPPATDTDVTEPTTTEEKVAEVKEAYKEAVVKVRSSIVTVSGKKAVSLRWTFPKDAPFDGYVIYKSTKRNSGFKAIKTIKKASTKKYTDKNVKSGQRYYYMVKTYKLVDGVKVWSVKHLKAWRTVK